MQLKQKQFLFFKYVIINSDGKQYFENKDAMKTLFVPCCSC